MTTEERTNITATGLDDFTAAYIEAALWSSTDETDEKNPLNWNYGIDDIAPKALEVIKSECAAFQRENAVDLALVPGYLEWTSAERSGHDFWLNRNGHGVGFWDRGYGELGERLSEACKKTNERYFYVSDGKIYQEQG